jgi:hypothetical protein
MSNDLAVSNVRMLKTCFFPVTSDLAAGGPTASAMNLAAKQHSDVFDGLIWG